MNGTMLVLLIASLMLSSNLFSPRTPRLPPLDESQVKIHWIQEGEPAPFDGILLNDYTYERMLLKIGE